MGGKRFLRGTGKEGGGTGDGRQKVIFSDIMGDWSVTQTDLLLHSPSDVLSDYKPSPQMGPRAMCHNPARSEGDKYATYSVTLSHLNVGLSGP